VIRRPSWGNLGLRTKLAVLIEGLLLLLALATGLLATGRMEATLESELTRRGLAIAGDLAMFSVKPLLAGDLATLRRFVNHTMSQEHVRSVAVLDTDGAVVMHSDLTRVGGRPDDAWTRRALASETAGHEDSLTGAEDPQYGLHVPVTASGARLGTVVVGYSRAAVRAEIGRARRQIASVWVLAAILSGGLAWLLASYVTRPITAIASAMQGAGGGEVRAVLAEGRRDEVGVLATSFNEMASDLARHRQHLSELVEARTAQLQAVNARLEEEIAARERVAAELRRSREDLRGLTSHLQSVREKERREIAREIHDELGQALTALKLDLHWAGRQLAAGAVETAEERIAAASKAIDATVHSVRRISSELRPKLLDDLGLSAALEWQAREFEQRARVACRIRSEPDDIVLDADRSTALFRIFQETLTNVARHARASRVDVVVTNFEGKVEMTVTDDGTGIRPEQVSDRRSLGILGMRERARSLGGRLEVSGRKGRGTSVRVTIPCAAGAEP
jgi:signal transduction histidine kinase